MWDPYATNKENFNAKVSTGEEEKEEEEVKHKLDELEEEFDLKEEEFNLEDKVDSIMTELQTSMREEAKLPPIDPESPRGSELETPLERKMQRQFDITVGEYKAARAQTIASKTDHGDVLDEFGDDEMEAEILKTENLRMLKQRYAREEGATLNAFKRARIQDMTDFVRRDNIFDALKEYKGHGSVVDDMQGENISNPLLEPGEEIKSDPTYEADGILDDIKGLLDGIDGMIDDLTPLEQAQADKIKDIVIRLNDETKEFTDDQYIEMEDTVTKSLTTDQKQALGVSLFRHKFMNERHAISSRLFNRPYGSLSVGERSTVNASLYKTVLTNPENFMMTLTHTADGVEILSIDTSQTEAVLGIDFASQGGKALLEGNIEDSSAFEIFMGAVEELEIRGLMIL